MRVNSSIFNVCLLSITFIVISLFLKYIASLIIPIVLGITAGLLFAPLLIFLRNKKIPMFLSVIIIVLVFITFGLIFSSVMVSSIYSISSEFSIYQQKILFMINSLTNKLPFINEDILLGVQKYIFDYLSNNILSYSRTVFESLARFTSQYLMVAFTMVFVLLERSLFYVKMDAIYKNRLDKSSELSSLILNINSQVSRFLLLKAMISFGTAIIIYIGFSFIGVDFKFIWAILTFLFNFIPTIGSIIITILTVAFSGIQFFPEWEPIVFVILLTLSVQMIVGNVLDPKVMGDNLNLSPLIIWIALIYWGWVWGIVGALLAIPLTVTIRIICEYIPGLHNIGLLMGNSGFLLKKKRHETYESLKNDNEHQRQYFKNLFNKFHKEKK